MKDALMLSTEIREIEDGYLFFIHKDVVDKVLKKFDNWEITMQLGGIPLNKHWGCRMDTIRARFRDEEIKYRYEEQYLVRFIKKEGTTRDKLLGQANFLRYLYISY